MATAKKCSGFQVIVVGMVAVAADERKIAGETCNSK
jgi:hypothetical protein